MRADAKPIQRPIAPVTRAPIALAAASHVSPFTCGTPAAWRPVAPAMTANTTDSTNTASAVCGNRRRSSIAMANGTTAVAPISTVRPDDERRVNATATNVSAASDSNVAPSHTSTSLTTSGRHSSRPPASRPRQPDSAGAGVARSSATRSSSSVRISRRNSPAAVSSSRRRVPIARKRSAVSPTTARPQNAHAGPELAPFPHAPHHSAPS